MNNCFLIPELLVQFCSFCDDPTLATLGRTARLFDCALDALWGSGSSSGQQIALHYLRPCFDIDNILPHGADCLRSVPIPIEPHHWERIYFYTKRIRAFSLDSSRVDLAFLAAFAFSAPPGGPLPKLQHLSLRAKCDEELIHAQEFLSPQLRTLGIQFFSDQQSAPEPNLTTLFRTLLTVRPDITELSVLIPSSPSFLPLLTVVGNLPHIRRLDLENVSAEHLPLISTLPTLTHLRLGDIFNSNVALPAWTGTCSTLTDASITATPDHIVAFFGSLLQCPLQDLEITIVGLENPTEFGEIIRVVTSKCQTHTLRHVAIFDPGWPSESPLNILGHHFVPFFDFPGITSFKCCLGELLCLDDSFISCLVTSWPNLVQLRLATRPRPFVLQSPRPTVKSFAMLAARCPKLFSIFLEFDFTTIGLVTSGEDVSKTHGEELVSENISNDSVEMLKVGYSPIWEPGPLAAYLHSLFPNITTTNYVMPYNVDQLAQSELRERWADFRMHWSRLAGDSESDVI